MAQVRQKAGHADPGHTLADAAEGAVALQREASHLPAQVPLSVSQRGQHGEGHSRSY